MSTKTKRKQIDRWAVPAFAVVAGIAMFVVAGLVRGDVRLGLTMLAIMVGYAAVLIVFRRAEPIAMLGEEGGDERRRMIQLRAGYVTLNVLALVMIAGFFVEMARGQDGEPWSWLGLVGAVSFAGSLIYFSRRG